MYVNWQTLITIAAVLTAIVTILKNYNKGYDWIRTQAKQEDEIKAIKEEQQLLTTGILACLKGLQEQGCDGSVSEAIVQIEAHLNKKAHA